MGRVGSRKMDPRTTLVGSVLSNDATSRRSRSVWVRPIFQRRGEVGAYNLLMKEMRESNDNSMFSSFTRMTPEIFDDLVSSVRPLITGSRRFRIPIPAELKLAVTLRYLATGDYSQSDSIVE
jgi:hypothetical protein